MFDDMFDTVEELMSGEKEGNLQSFWDRRPRNCAHGLDMPDLPRQTGYPIGLKNQGATCYLNSLLQILFHTPEFRSIVLSLPLCKDTLEERSDFVDKARHSFLLGFQRLFSEMSGCDVRAVGTQYLNAAMGWQGKEHTEQQDIQEAMRVIFDTFQRALVGTDFSHPLKCMFKGSTIKYKTCRVCTENTQRMETFYDLPLQVKGIPSVQASLMALTTPESMDGDNKITCDSCGIKQDMWLGSRLDELPGTLVLTFNRFDFDYEKMDRVKLNDRFEFALEEDFKTFMAPHPDPDYYTYELYGVLIHQGSAHGGHYICYIRDLLSQSNWAKGREEALAEQAKAKEQKKQEDKKEDNKKEEKKPELIAEPQNKKLLENWYKINDNIVTAIDPSLIATQYEGSESAYILFYRRRSLSVEDIKIKIPDYFASGIQVNNEVLVKQRQAYDFEKQHILINIEGNQHKLKVSTRISQFMEAFVPKGAALVFQSEHNGLPYFPMQIVNSPDHLYQADATLQSLDVIHESKWKVYQLSSPEYETIKATIGKDRLPFELVLLDGQQPKKIVCYSDENFLMLRLRIEKDLKVPYEKQVLKLITSYKEVVLTQKSENDEALLPRLGVNHGVQIQVKSLAVDDGEEHTEAEDKKDMKLLCFIIQRDDVIGLKRIYFEKDKNLEQLMAYFKAAQNIEPQVKHRFRNMSNNRLYYPDHYAMPLSELDFAQEMVKLRLQRGEIPIKGDVCVKVKVQSQLLPLENGQEPIHERIFDPNAPLSEVKEWACQQHGLDPAQHKLYMTDWLGEPVRSLTRQKQSIFEHNFSRQELVCLRDLGSPIGSELVHMELFETLTGAPDSCEITNIYIKIEEFKTVQDLKQLILESVPQLQGVQAGRLRLRERKRDYMFGGIWRDSKKSVKNATSNSTKIVYQVLDHPQALSDDQIVVILKKRNTEKQVYENGVELIFEAGKSPSVEQFIEAAQKKLQLGEEPIKLIKYFHYEFEWVDVNRENIEKLVRSKKGGNKQQKKNNKNDQKGKNKQKQQNGDNKQQDKQKKAEQDKPKQEPAAAIEKHEEHEKKDEKVAKPQNQDQKGDTKKEGKQKGNKQKGNKGNKGGKDGQQAKNKLLEECQNLRKAPILLKDGDLIGWGLVGQLVGDDFQTEQDLSLRAIHNSKASYKGGGDQGGFKIKVGF